MKAKGMKKGGKMYAKGGPAKRAKKTARLKKIGKAVGRPQKTKDKTQKMAPQKMKKGGKMMAKGMRKGGKMMAKGMRKGGKTMVKGKRMNGKKNMGLYGRK